MGGKNKNKKQGEANKKERDEEESSSNNQKKQEGTKDPEKQAQINKILQAVNSMDLDNPDFIDVKSFDEGKQILLNAIDDLNSYINMFKKGEYSKFPAPANTEKSQKAETK